MWNLTSKSLLAFSIMKATVGSVSPTMSQTSVAAALRLRQQIGAKIVPRVSAVIFVSGSEETLCKSFINWRTIFCTGTGISRIRYWMALSFLLKYFSFSPTLAWSPSAKYERRLRLIKYKEKLIYFKQIVSFMSRQC